MDANELEKLKEEYRRERPKYEKFCTEVVTQLNEMLSSAGVTPALPIQYRVKV